MSAVKRVVGLSAAFAAALNGTMVMPLIVMALARIPGISEATATLVASAEIAGIALYCLLAPRLVSRSRRLVTVGGLLALVLGEAASHFLTGVASLSAARLLAGLGEGALFSLITCEVAAEANAERIWGQINVLGGVCMGLLLFGLSALPVADGRGSLFLWLAAMGLLMAPFILTIQARPRQDVASALQASSLGKSQIGLILLVVVLVYCVQAGQWAVSGYMGASSHIAPATVGLYLAISSIVGFVGAVVPSLTRNPAYRLRFVLLGFLVMALAIHVFFNLLGEMPFLLGQVLVNIGFYMVTPFVIGLLTENDRDGALVLRTLVIALIGAAVGTALAGELFVQSGPLRFSVAAILAVVVSMGCAAVVFRRLRAPDLPAVVLET
ncbi:MFS transporter [Chitinimonas naiadis]